MDELNEIYRYCRDRIPMFKEKESIALRVMDEYRCDLHNASDLYEEMLDCITQWADENGYSIDFFDDIDVEGVFWAGPGED